MLSRVGFLKGHQAKSLVYFTTKCPSTTTPDAVKTDDTSLFRRPVRQEPGKVRLGFLPEEWFTFFYKKTGVTGPYTFGVGLSTYLLSKEYYVLEHEFYNGLSLFLLCFIVVKKFGPAIAKYLDKEIDNYETEMNSGRTNEKEMLESQIKNEEHNQWSSEEAAYRNRLMQSYSEVKKRLDYQMERQNVERRIAQKHLVNWVLKNVLASITTEQEKQNIDKCKMKKCKGGEDPFHMREIDFQNVFRLSRDGVRHLVEVLGPHLVSGERSTALSVESKIFSALAF
ncbi:hypothetical protein RN001_001396 [Aquatica leii]|uniref:ATP synthase subunit b n=1 Tax=Aquatica leii TaxID=1421715 RepID=A0AAN7QAC7_9COLE|nr:hypothetical protein RN001_001396 [Aquatica leii]